MLQGCAFAEPCSFEFIEPAQRSSTTLPSHVILRKYTVPPLPGTQMRACALHASQHSCAVYTLKDIPQFSEPPLKPACCVGWHDGSAWYESRGGGDDASGGGGGGDVSGGRGDTSGGERISDASVRIVFIPCLACNGHDVTDAIACPLHAADTLVGCLYHQGLDFCGDQALLFSELLIQEDTAR